MTTRPYISLNGGRTNGPQAKPSTKIETQNVANDGDVVPKSCMTR